MAKASALTSDQAVQISLLSAQAMVPVFDDLSKLLHACVHAGASIGFILPFTDQESQEFWRQKILPEVQHKRVMLFAAQHGGRIAGTVQLDCNTPANQVHRAEVRKLLVHPDYRRRGIAKKLMVELERAARQLRRTLLTLDTRTGDHAEPLYLSLGYHVAGRIPLYCRDTKEDRRDPTTIMYKML